MSRPRILLSTSSLFRNTGLRRTDTLTGLNYAEAVVQAGGLPLLASNLGPELAEDFVGEVDGVIFTGGVDVDPSFFGAEPHPQLGLIDTARDRFELALYRAARARGLPILGVCRGIQLINVAEGGSLHQHLPALPGTIQHEQGDTSGTPFHTLTLEPGSVIARAFSAERVRCNSYHHQAADRVGESLRVTARSSDGVVEALEGTRGPFLLGVQWHPEMSVQAYPEHLAPFRALVEAVEEAKLVGR